MPREFGDDNWAHRSHRWWVRLKLLERVWAVFWANCDEPGGVDWDCQAADAAMGKARCGGDLIGPNPTERHTLARVERSLERAWAASAAAEGRPSRAAFRAMRS